MVGCPNLLGFKVPHICGISRASILGIVTVVLGRYLMFGHFDPWGKAKECSARPPQVLSRRNRALSWACFGLQGTLTDIAPTTKNIMYGKILVAKPYIRNYREPTKMLL